MALSTRTIQDSINWAKRLSFNRNPVIGNSLEPALTSASMIMQTILAPPFEWWWNNEEVVFTCNPTPNSATSTVVAISGGVLTVTAANTFQVGQLIRPAGLVTLTGLNGLIIEIATSSSTQFTATVNLANGSDTVGTFANTTTQDYVVSVPAFSHIEHASVQDLDASGNPLKWYELTVKNNLSLESSQNRPEFISAHTEDGNGNTTFRVSSAPDKKYPVAIHVQLAAPTLSNGVNSTWAPLPDFMQYIYDWGFLSLLWHFADDPRAGYANDKFVSGILSRAEGLTEQERNIFLANWNNLQTAEGVGKQMGAAARGK